METREEIKEKAEHYLTAYGGNMLTAGPTFFNEKKHAWIVPIFYGPLFADFPLDEMEFNEEGDLIYTPSTQKLSGLIRLRFGDNSKELTTGSEAA